MGGATNRRVPHFHFTILVIIVNLKYSLIAIKILNKSNILITIGLILLGLIILKVAMLQTDKANESNLTPENIPVEFSPSSNPQPENMQPGAYIDYSDEAFVGSAGTKRILFFYSDKNPKSVTLGQEITLLSDQIPENVTFLRINYDAETEMNSTYKILSPNVLIQVDQKDQEISRWTDGKFEDILKSIK